ncbi:hypothetical protein COX93_03415 [Candidatus Nomurabacteria bacterium CG_4_10_14_0_2_um_filter_30_12]|uniref:Uncharacterized protein n=2 Tax=Candidatus Nomuraibacteriota TaxID=1752729 RepID=A0A2J0MEU8_9BACT|nr:MAG: hypothetical protein COX93_03415 [Candidatus Nomurabacteria bacterium CG_4_10_14_0_2_um_filter_30_12]
MLTDLLFTNVAYASVDSIVEKINKLIINPIIVFLFALAVVYFLYGIFQFIANQDNEEAKTKGKNHIIWGTIGIVIMIGVFTILGIIMRTFNIEGIDPQMGTVQIK